MSETYICCSCDIEKPLKAFHQSKKANDGRVCKCIDCTLAWDKDKRKLKKPKYLRKCTFCNTPFIGHVPSAKFCSPTCKVQNRRSKSWKAFLIHLIHTKKKQDGLSVEDLLDVYEKQKGRCALSGIELTRIVGQGWFKMNASVDRIEAGGPYIKENIQLVCLILNKFRVNTPINEYIWWCKKVADYHD